MKLTQLLAPIMPFMTEDMYQNLAVHAGVKDAGESLHLTAFPEANPDLIDEELIREIDTVIKIVSMGRAARNKANIKVRQPLQTIQVKTRYDYEEAAVQKLENQILQELNIKSLEIVDDVDELVQHKVTPNFAVVGKKYGSLVPQIKQALETSNQEELYGKVSTGENIPLQFNGEALELLPDEVSVETIEPEDLAVVEDAGYVAAINTEITEELKKECMVRDLVRYVQNMRKDAGYQVEDHIRIGYETSGDLLDAIQEYESYFQNEILADELTAEAISGDLTENFNIGEETIQVTIEKI
jgi:isoleucyl-tRNA synthetase